MPVAASVIDYLFKDFEDSFVRRLSLTITLEVVRSRKVVMDMESITNLINILILEGTPIVCNDRKGNTIVANDIIEDENYHFLTGDLSERYDLNPIFEILCGCNNEFISIGILRVNLAHENESPLTKGSWISD